MQSVSSTVQETPYKPVKTRGDRGAQYQRKKWIGNRTAKEMGVKKGMKSIPYYYAYCDHKNARGKPDCEYSPGKKKFTGVSPELVMGNKAAHEHAHEEEDRRAAERAF